MKLGDARRMRIATYGALALVGVLLAAGWGLRPRGGAAGPEAPTSPALAVGAPVDRATPSLGLVDDHGTPTALSSLRGKWVVLAPSMTLCSEVCPITTGTLMTVERRLRHDGLSGRVVVAEATVDPWRDSPARLRAYRRLTGADFRLFTGSQSQIRRLWGFFGVFYQRVAEGRPPDTDWVTHKPETMDVEHTDGLFVLDPAGVERVVVVGTPDAGHQLSAPLRGLLNAQGRQVLAHPRLPWNAAEVVNDLYSLMGRAASSAAPAPPEVSPPNPVEAARDLAGSPPALASLHAEAGRLLGGSNDLTSEVRRLRGHPVVLNAWASWCPPCRAEFPIFAATSVVYGRQVAFVGADTDDDAGNAARFLAQHPVSYPSYTLSASSLAAIAAIVGTPTTIFLDTAGRVVYTHLGVYVSQAALEHDVDSYALPRESSSRSSST